MARPKPAEESEAVLIRLPKSAADRLREMAARSRSAKGQALSANQYCVAILTEAVERGTTVVERLRYDLIESPPTLRVAEPIPEERKDDTPSP